ncbi:hypothetical protein [Rhodococcus indonesiensis]
MRNFSAEEFAETGDRLGTTKTTYRAGEVEGRGHMLRSGLLRADSTAQVLEVDDEATECLSTLGVEFGQRGERTFGGFVQQCHSSVERSRASRAGTRADTVGVPEPVEEGDDGV